MKYDPDQQPVFQTFASRLEVLCRGLFWVALLLFAGIALGGLFRRWGQEKLYRWAGGMSALAGVWVALQF